jgi:23S rRNA pseudouridine1911/1915/1917 synthase
VNHETPGISSRAFLFRAAIFSGKAVDTPHRPDPMNETSALVYCDHRLAVINKPPGLSLATRRSEPQAAALRLIAALPPEARLGYGLDSSPLWLVHRLDIGTTGLVLLARDEETHRQLSGWISRRLIHKTYVALAWGHPRPGNGTFAAPLGPDRIDRRRMKVDPKGRPALTRYRTLAAGKHVSLVELNPETGRTHQLRVHLSAGGNWIVGDDLYCGPRHRGVRDPHLQSLLNPPHPFLHAWRLELPDASGFMPSRFEAALPADFAAALDALRMSHMLR